MKQRVDGLRVKQSRVGAKNGNNSARRNPQKTSPVIARGPFTLLRIHSVKF